MQDIIAERDFYDKLFAEKPENEHIVAGYEELHDQAFVVKPKGAVLDLGCGTGGHAIHLARRGFDVIAVDLTVAGVKGARERLRREGFKGRFFVADAERLPLRNGAIDTTWTSLLLHHFPRLDKLPGELARITRSRVIAFEPNSLNPLSWFAFNIVNPIWGLSSTTKNQRALNPGKLEKTFAQVGLKASKLHFVHRPWADGAGLMAMIRKVYTTLTGWLPLSRKANKFLIIFDKQGA